MNSKKILSLCLIPLMILLNLTAVSAKNVVLAVMNANNLDPIHEQPIYNILTSMNNTVTPIDQNSHVNFSNFDLLVVAGRPYSATPLPQSFMQSLPVNSMPTIGIDFSNLYGWGWASSGGANAMQSSSAQSVYITSNNHPITAGYITGQRVFVDNQSGLDAVDIVAGTSNFTFVAYLDTQGDGGIAYAPPNTVLANGRTIANNSTAIFFGTPWPAYWTSDAQTMFMNAVNWITNLNYTPPTSTVLSGPSMTVTSSAQYSWTQATGVNGIQMYEIQVSTISDFSLISSDVKTTSLTYSLTNMMDGQRYYLRVRSIDFLNQASQWSNTVSTIADFAPIILTMTSPTNGANLQLGQAVNVSVSVSSPRIQPGSLCTVWVGQTSIGTILFNQTTGGCFGNVTIPLTLGADGLGPSTFSVSIPDQLGATNSTNVTVNFNRQITVTVSPSSSSYSTGSQVPVSGSVKTADNSAPVPNANVQYSVSTANGTAATDANGNYNFTLVAGGDGNYQINVTAVYNTIAANSSATFTVGSQSQSSSSSESSGGSSSFSQYPIIFIDNPDSVTATDGSPLSFQVTVKNGGNMDLHSVKLSLQGLSFNYDINPNIFNLYVGDSKSVTINMDIPQGSVGAYPFKIFALAYESQRASNMNLTVNQKPVPVAIANIDVTSLDIPLFTSGKQTLVNLTLTNSGNATASTTATISLPTGWTVDKTSQDLTLDSGEQKQISFLVTPSDSEGNITLSGTYTAGSNQNSFSKTASATLSTPVNSGINLQPFTGALGLLSNPTAVILFAIGAAVLVVLAYKFEFGKIETGPKYKNPTRNSPRKKHSDQNNDYEAWERAHGQ